MSDENKGGDSAVTMAILILIVSAAILIALWFAFHPQISKSLSWIRYGQMQLATLWIDEDKERLSIKPTQEMAQMVYRHERKLKDPRSFEAWREYLPDANGNNFKFMDLAPATQLALTPYKYIIIVIFGLFGAYILFFGPTSQFRRKLDIDSLIGEQANNFPQIRPFIKFDPRKIDPRAPGDPVPSELPMFTEALGPEEWVAFHKITFDDKKLDREMARRAFEEQLGPRWQGAKALEPYQQVLLAAFTLKSIRQRDEADDMLGRIASCWSHDKGLNLNSDRSLKSEALKILRNKEHTKGIFGIMKQHAYVVPAMVRALDYARSEGGVMAPAQFVWLRAHDRNLWYALNNLGKQAYHIESLGSLAHYKNEKRTMRPIPVPKIDDAVDSIEEHMNSEKARPIPELDYGPNHDDKKTAGVMKPLGSS